MAEVKYRMNDVGDDGAQEALAKIAAGMRRRRRNRAIRWGLACVLLLAGAEVITYAVLRYCQ